MHKVYYKTIDADVGSLFNHANKLKISKRKYQLEASGPIGSKSFSNDALKIWNCMPNKLKEIECHKKFKSKMTEFKDQINLFSFKYRSFNFDKDYVYY